MSIHVVVMGVAGCGKSTVAEAIHERLGYVYAEGDDFHRRQISTKCQPAFYSPMRTAGHG